MCTEVAVFPPVFRNLPYEGGQMNTWKPIPRIYILPLSAVLTFLTTVYVGWLLPLLNEVCRVENFSRYGVYWLIAQQARIYSLVWQLFYVVAIVLIWRQKV